MCAKPVANYKTHLTSVIALYLLYQKIINKKSEVLFLIDICIKGIIG